MKNILAILLFVVTGFALVSCNNSAANAGGMTDEEKKNLETARAMAKMFETGDWSKTGDYVATDAVDHAGMQGDVKGVDNIKASFDEMSKMMGNFKNETVKEAADGDYIFQWLKESSTMKVDDPTMGKAGTAVTFNSVEVSRFKDGKIVEHWSFMDMKDMMKMMPQPTMNSMPMKRDTAKAK